jgi:hypothetical protein
MLRAAALTLMASATMASAQAADYSGPVILAPVETDGVPCIFEDYGPVIDLPWPSVWLGHFSGGHFVDSAYGPVLDWHDEKVCFPSKASCNRWIGANRRALHNPEGDWTCLPIR